MHTLPAGAVGAVAVPVHAASSSVVSARRSAAKFTVESLRSCGARAGSAMLVRKSPETLDSESHSIAPVTVCPEGIVSQAAADAA